MIDKKKIIEFVKTIVIALIIALFFRSTIAAPYKIPTGSMIPTLLVGDYIFVSRLSYSIKLPFTNINLIPLKSPTNGDVVVFKYPIEKKKDFIKRLIGVAGDTIEIRNSMLYVNGKEIFRYPVKPAQLDDEGKYIEPGVNLYRETINEKEHTIQFYDSPQPRDFGPIEVPEDYIFVMGDNRDTSSDSRMWGFVDLKLVRGKAKVIWLSLDKEVPFYKLWNKIRFDRLLRPIY